MEQSGLRVTEFAPDINASQDLNATFATEVDFPLETSLVDLVSFENEEPVNPAGVIDIKLSKISQLFNSYDPSPFLEKDLDDDAEDYIVAWARELPRKVPLTLMVHLPAEVAIHSEVGALQDSIRKFFFSRVATSRREVRAKLMEALKGFLVGMVIVIVCLTLRGLAMTFIVTEQLVLLTLLNMLTESLDIAAWVCLWVPVQTFLYKWWPTFSKLKLFKRLAVVDVRIRVREHGASAQPPAVAQPEFPAGSNPLPPQGMGLTSMIPLPFNSKVSVPRRKPRKYPLSSFRPPAPSPAHPPQRAWSGESLTPTPSTGPQAQATTPVSAPPPASAPSRADQQPLLKAATPAALKARAALQGALAGRGSLFAAVTAASLGLQQAEHTLFAALATPPIPSDAPTAHPSPLPQPPAGHLTPSSSVASFPAVAAGAARGELVPVPSEASFSMAPGGPQAEGSVSSVDVQWALGPNRRRAYYASPPTAI
ncbi:hypothetical protein PAPYR_3836 [Paratrimastix pyriformis]|uniref:Uncharacterized protein n=1 Tax=Paratrimastix pyriformis TaxID=342808 RepID=A0ABQ8ULP8_9EUKA|nr:hypothetical protein PAPYR_3836 [Paratrimastix pyriformis]